VSARARAVITAATLVVAAVIPVLGAGPAQAATYRYWTYWWGTNTATTHSGWKFASVGPSGQTVADQAVLGWRFATTSAAGTTKPRYAATYGDICSDAKPGGTDVRVAVVVDFGSSSDWPPGETPPVVGKVYTRCLTVAAGTRASSVMGQAQLDLRIGGNGLICGIDGFPSHECAPIVSDPKPTPRPTPKPTPKPTATHAPAPSTSASATTARPVASGSTSASGAATAATATSAAPSTSGPAAGTTPSASALAGTGDTASPTDSLLPATTDAPVASAAEGTSSTPWGAVGGLALVALVGGAAWWTMRRGGAR
jgi:hypothetical protein